MIDLYEVLGVPRDADAATIRRAYRKKVRSVHPDSGGSVEAFNELKTAYDVLSDPVRRRRYDEHGEVGDPAADPHRAKVIEILSVGLDFALLKLSKIPHARKDSDIVRLTSEALCEKSREWGMQMSHFQKALDEACRLKDRFRVSEGENLMEAAVATRISACQKQVDLLDSRIKLVEEALVILHNTHFDAPLELETDLDPLHELTDDQKRVHSLLDRSNLVWFK